MHWLASNTFKLAHRNWVAFVAIQADGMLIIDYDFMMEISSDLQQELPEFNAYMTWYLEAKECNSI